ncbi:MAG: InlB B-repeat-containing protein, partial [Clostridia bacterium]|nr:InlB B-repeat-containing protein [Clostridia bacterium]
SAKWIANENAIIFNANGGTGTMPNMTIATDSQAELTSNAFTKTGYTFIGWATSASGSVLYADEASYTMGTNSSYTLYAVWEANQNTLVFNANGGSGTMQNMTIATDSIVNLTANVFTKPGYTFKGWSTIEDGDAEYVDGADYVMGTNGSYTLYAVWETVSFDIIYKLNGGTNGANPNKYTVEQKITLKSPTRAGYTFGGWYTESSFVNRVTSIVKGTIGAKTLYARWIPKNNTLVFDANGGKGTMQNMVISTDASENLISNAFTKDGYTFKGWATTPSGSVAYSNATSYTMGTNDSYTLYAVWEANKNTLIFDANGGSGTMQNMIISTDSSENLISNSYVKVGYEFIGWSTSQTGDVMYLDNSCYTMGPNSTYTLYARWIPLKYGIVYNLDGGSNHSSNLEIFTIENLPFSLEKATKSGYTFSGWFMDQEYNLPITQITEPKNITIYAKFDYGTEGLKYSLSDFCASVIGYEGTEKEVIIPNTYNNKLVTKIEQGAFSYCTSLTSVTIPDSVTSIGEYAFSSCTRLTSITIPNSVTEIGAGAFRDCYSLTEINFNATAMNDLSSSNEVFSYAGQNGGGIKVTIGKNVTKIPDYLFYPSASNSYSPKITSVIFEEGSVCESIGESAFSGCDSLTSITIPDSVTSIGNYAFRNCTSLTSVTIGESVTSIGYSAFYGCTALTSITIPDSVTTIELFAFDDCDSLTTINCEAESQPSGWSSDWKYGCSATVKWGYTEE